MRLGDEQVGRWGLALLAVTGAVGLIIAFHGWSARRAGLPAGALSPAQTASPHRATATPSARPSPTAHRPLLKSQPYASVAYRIWPGSPSEAAKLALTGLKVSVSRQRSVLLVTAGVNGQPVSAPRRYPGGALVYVIEASLGDDSGSTDYNLGDDALVVTDARGGIIR
jgi:hypothetical protein